MNKPKELAEWWIKNYKHTEPAEKDVQILLLNEEEFTEFVLNIENVEALQSLCTFLKGALDYEREKCLTSS